MSKFLSVTDFQIGQLGFQSPINSVFLSWSCKNYITDWPFGNRQPHTASNWLDVVQVNIILRFVVSENAKSAVRLSDKMVLYDKRVCWIYCKLSYNQQAYRYDLLPLTVMWCSRFQDQAELPYQCYPSFVDHFCLCCVVCASFVTNCSYFLWSNMTCAK